MEEKIKSAIRDVLDFPKPGIIFKDITPIFQDPELCTELIEHIYQSVKDLEIDAVAGIEARGFLLGPQLALRLGVPFIPVRKAGKLPYKTIQYSYDLEYGSATIEMHEDAVQKGAKVLIHDDLLATGGTADAAAELIKKLHGEVAAFSFLVNLDFLSGKDLLSKHTNTILCVANY